MDCELPSFSEPLSETSFDSSNLFSSLDVLSQESLSSQHSTITSASLYDSNDDDKSRKRTHSNKNILTKLRVLSLNCNSTRSQHKSGILKALIDSGKPHIILGSESKLDSSVSNNEVFLGQYEIFRKDRMSVNEYEIFRKDRMSVNLGGGVFIAIRNTILATHQVNLDSATEAIWVKIEFVKQKPLYLASVYRPRGNQEEPLDELEKSLLSFQSKGYPCVVIAGDFNVPDIKWDQLSISSNAIYGLSLNQKMLSIVDNSAMCQLVTFPTRGQSILDLVLTSHPDLLTNI